MVNGVLFGVRRRRRWSLQGQKMARIIGDLKAMKVATTAGRRGGKSERRNGGKVSTRVGASARTLDGRTTAVGCDDGQTLIV